MSADVLLEVEGLAKEYSAPKVRWHGRRAEAFRAVDDVTFTIHRNETLGLVGESGSGKSTIAYCIGQLLSPSAGVISFRGVDLTSLSGSDLRRARRDLQIVFQDPHASLNPRMTVASIVGEPFLVYKEGRRAERERRVSELLELVGLDPAHGARYPHEFSGGQRQRIGIARAVALRPQLIVCDEPVSALDVSVQAQILNLLKDLQDELGISYLFISHDLSVVRNISDRVAVLKRGKIVELGATESVYRQPQHEYTRQLLASIPGL